MLNHRQFLLPAVLSAALLTSACGGGGGDGGADAAPPAPPNIGQSVSALLSFMNSLIAATSETSEPIDINPLTLVVDDMGEPAAL